MGILTLVQALMRNMEAEYTAMGFSIAHASDKQSMDAAKVEGTE